MQVVDKIDLAAMALNELVANKRHVSSFLDRSEDVQALCNAVLTDDETNQIQIIDSIIENGITIKEVYECFIPEAAALLGIYWEESRISFSEVSLGSQRLQKLARVFEKNYLGSFYSFGPGPEVMLVLPEGELHMLGLVLAAGMFRKEGANPSLSIGRPFEEVLDEMRIRKFSLVGVSLVNKDKVGSAISFAKKIKTYFNKTPLVLGTRINSLELSSEDLEVFDLITPNPKDALRYLEVNPCQ